MTTDHSYRTSVVSMQTGCYINYFCTCLSIMRPSSNNIEYIGAYLVTLSNHRLWNLLPYNIWSSSSSSSALSSYLPPDLRGASTQHVSKSVWRMLSVSESSGKQIRLHRSTEWRESRRWRDVVWYRAFQARAATTKNARSASDIRYVTKLYVAKKAVNELKCNYRVVQ